MSMTVERAKSELMQIYGALSPDKQRAIDTLVKIEPCEDAISRQAILEEFEKDQYHLEFCKEHYIERSISMEMVRIRLHDLPSVNPQEPKIKNEYNGIGCDECEVTKSQGPKVGE